MYMVYRMGKAMQRGVWETTQAQNCESHGYRHNMEAAKDQLNQAKKVHPTFTPRTQIRTVYRVP